MLEGSGDWSATVKCRWAWHHYTIINPTSKLNRILSNKIYILYFAIELTLFYIHCLLFRLLTHLKDLHKTSRFYQIGIVVNDRNVVLKFLDLCMKIQYFIWSVQNNVAFHFMKVFNFPTYAVFAISLMLTPTHINLAWGYVI